MALRSALSEYVSWRVIEPSQEHQDAYPHSADVTHWLTAMAEGDSRAEDELFKALYSHLRQMAGRMMAGQPIDHTLQPTAVVSEAYLKVVGQVGGRFVDRSHFLSVASRAMRHLLVDHARKRKAAKRSTTGTRVGLDSVVDAFEERSQSLEGLNSALEEFADFDPEMALAIELRFFGGAAVEEVAEQLNISVRTFERRWRIARHYLRSQLLLQ